MQGVAPHVHGMMLLLVLLFPRTVMFVDDRQNPNPSQCTSKYLDLYLGPAGMKSYEQIPSVRVARVLELAAHQAVPLTPQRPMQNLHLGMSRTGIAWMRRLDTSICSLCLASRRIVAW